MAYREEEIQGIGEVTRHQNTQGLEKLLKNIKRILWAYSKLKKLELSDYWICASQRPKIKGLEQAENGCTLMEKRLSNRVGRRLGEPCW